MTDKDKLKKLEKDFVELAKTINKGRIKLFLTLVEIVRLRRKMNYACTPTLMYEKFNFIADVGFSFYCSVEKYCNFSNQETDKVLNTIQTTKSIGNKRIGLSLNKVLLALNKSDSAEELNSLLNRIDSEKWSTGKVQKFKRETEFRMEQLYVKINAIEELYEFVNPINMDIKLRGNCLTRIKLHKQKTDELIKKFDDGLLK